MASTTDIYNAFKFGARLRTEDVDRLLRSRGHALSANRLREISRGSDRGAGGSALTLAEIYDLISAWADERDAP